ncbi:MAG: dipeptidase [Gemmatimonadetes bacterium]|nr:dipeptidase [Gemmatimonadota bacterium]NIR80466.1 dipeptidase [Gemmatimonadota bacterium]NIT89227.1 dipeptidase [Gemmatimonadota bacterium]NIU33026.1 dipeptidase [Gemmatimonadota bacterium]NIU37410.1 dipeptidase [Gemmatimonadota bacterium]
MSGSEAYIRGEIDRFREELFDFLRIPSVSARSEHDGDTREAARWLSERLEDAGLDAEVFQTDGHPIVVGEWRGAGEDAPTLLVYGHYDVQPPEPLDEWTSPPFEPEIRDGRIYARGSADDKGQLFMHVKALEARLRADDGLPVNVVVLAEGEEESGSASLVPFLRGHRERLACDGVVISDSAMFAPGTPSLLFSLRGMAYFQLDVRGPRSDLHSGSYGGAVTNPANAAARIVASFHDDDGRIAIPGFYDRVVEWDRQTRERIADLPFDEEEYRDDLGVAALSGEAGYSTLERLWIRPTCDVNGLLSGYTGEGAKTVLPARAMVKVSFRLVPDQDPERVARLLAEHVRSVTPPGVKVEISELHGGRPWRAVLEGPLFEAAGRALERAFGRRPVLTGEGGSIPIVVDFEELLEAPCLLVGFALPGANMHAPDEWLAVENFEKGTVALALLYDELAEFL